MTERNTELKKRFVVGRKADGRRCYDPQAKQELIAASLHPGVSIARMALEHGINANLLRTWISKRQPSSASSAGQTAFVPVVPVRGNAPVVESVAALSIRLPNGIRLECATLPAEQLTNLLHLLITLPCSESIPD